MLETKRLEIADLTRELRQQFGLSQEKLAAKLGVSLRTVNRWENGHAAPSQLALKQIEEMLRKLGEAVQGLLSEYFSQAE